jgi:hypothetical protein
MELGPGETNSLVTAHQAKTLGKLCGAFAQQIPQGQVQNLGFRATSVTEHTSQNSIKTIRPDHEGINLVAVFIICQ